MILDFFLPARCAACGAPGREICSRCEAAVTSSAAILINGKDATPPLTALGAYDGALRSMVLALKFRGARSVGVRLGRWLAPQIVWPFEAVVPVPLHAARLRERGYNQAADIARGIAAWARRPCIETALLRSRNTAPQSALDLARRATNVDGAFTRGRSAHEVVNRGILIVDDVVTTGATLRACADALRAVGSHTLYAACAAVRL
jgi:ComF family protein